jgi:hypothetical protein
VGLLTPRPTPKLEGHPLLSVHDWLFNIFAANLHIWKPFLHPQPEDAPCCGDRNPTLHGKNFYIHINVKVNKILHKVNVYNWLHYSEKCSSVKLSSSYIFLYIQYRLMAYQREENGESNNIEIA